MKMTRIKNENLGLLKMRFKKLAANKLSMIGMIIFTLMLLASVLAPLITRYSPTALDMTNMAQPPSAEHVFGTDRLGRDLFAQILYGGRVSIYVGMIGAMVSALLGTALGCIGGYFGGKIDGALIKLSELFQSFPQLILVMILAGIFGQGVNNLIIIFSISGWMTTFRMVRNQFVSAKEEMYVQACKAFGFSNLSIMFKQILPNIASPVFVSLTINTANYILHEAGLSFLGLGVPVTTPTWGNIMNVARSLQVVTEQWWLWLFPGLTISLFVLSVNFFGDGLRDVLDSRN